MKRLGRLFKYSCHFFGYYATVVVDVTTGVGVGVGVVFVFIVKIAVIAGSLEVTVQGDVVHDTPLPVASKVVSLPTVAVIVTGVPTGNDP